MRHADEEGSATVWALSLSFLLMAVIYSVLLVCVAVGTRHHAEAAADLAALAGASAAQLGVDGCSVASRVAAANMARLTRCVVEADRSVTVDVQVVTPTALSSWAAGAVRATAKAGS